MNGRLLLPPTIDVLTTMWDGRLGLRMGANGVVRWPFIGGLFLPSTTVTGAPYQLQGTFGGELHCHSAHQTKDFLKVKVLGLGIDNTTAMWYLRKNWAVGIRNWPD